MTNQTHTIDGSVSINGLQIQVHNRTDAIGLKMLLDAFLAATGTGHTLVATIGPPTVTTPRPAPGSTRISRANVNTGNSTRERIIQAFEGNPNPMYSAEIVRLMEGNGWESNAQDKKRYVEVVMYRDKATFRHLKGGKWTPTHGNSYLQPAANETVEDIQPIVEHPTLLDSMDRIQGESNRLQPGVILTPPRIIKPVS